MVASRGTESKESKDQIVRIEGTIPHGLFTNSIPLVKIISGYRGEASSDFAKFFSDSSLQGEILIRARYAAPLDEVEALIRNAHTRDEDHLADTLVKATLRAIRDCDVSIRDDNNNVIHEGMAERLMGLCEELYPKTYAEKLFPICLEQARLAEQLENKEQKEDKERDFKAEIKKVFDANKENNDKTAEALQAFKDWTKKLSVADKILAIYLTRVELADRGGELRSIEEKDQGKWYGLLGDRFCNEVIWEALQKNLSPRQQQIAECGVYYVFNPSSSRKLIRTFDINSASFLGGRIDFYDDYGRRWAAARLGMRRAAILLQAIASASKLYATAAATNSSPSAQLTCDVEIRRSPTAIAVGQ